MICYQPLLPKATAEILLSIGFSSHYILLALVLGLTSQLPVLKPESISDGSFLAHSGYISVVESRVTKIQLYEQVTRCTEEEHQWILLVLHYIL